MPADSYLNQSTYIDPEPFSEHGETDTFFIKNSVVAVVAEMEAGHLKKTVNKSKSSLYLILKSSQHLSDKWTNVILGTLK